MKRYCCLHCRVCGESTQPRGQRRFALLFCRSLVNFEFLCCFLQVVGGLRMRAAFAADAPVEIPVEEFQGRCALGQNLALAIFVIDDVYTCMMLMIRAGCNAATCAV